jgi:hypothetical protein
MHVFEFYVSHILKKLFKYFMLFLRRSAVVSKPCPARPASPTPLDIIRMGGVPRWTFLPICVWFDHSPMPKQCARATCIFPRDPKAPEAPFHQNPSSCVPRRLPPLDVHRKGVEKCSLLLVCVWLGHSNMTKQGWTQVSLVRTRTEKAIRVYLWTPQSRVSPDKDHRSIVNPRKLTCMCP